MQKPRAVHGGVAGSVNPAVQVLKNPGLKGRTGENVDIFRPMLRKPGAITPHMVVVSRGDDHGNGGLLQSRGQGFIAFPGVGAVKQVSGEKQQLALLFPAQPGNGKGQLQGGFPEGFLLLRGEALEGGVQVKISGVKKFHIPFPPFLRIWQDRFGCRW